MTSILVFTPAFDIELTETDQQRDALDEFNHSRLRRALILQELQTRKHVQIRVVCQDDDDDDVNNNNNDVLFQQIYSPVHTPGLLEFLQTAPERWEALGRTGQDPGACLDTNIQAMIPICMPLMRTKQQQQQPSQHVVGQMGYYCTDTCTPIFTGLREELYRDAYLLHCALQQQQQESSSHNIRVLLPTHPGHHAASDCFGGYCYTNHAAALAAAFPQERVAILDVDYHCGNGTAAIFDADPRVLVVSLHCDPNYDYPFHTGFADDTGTAAGTTCHLPLPPGTDWAKYKPALQQGLEKIRLFQATRCIVSLGLDTYDQDPCALRRAGFVLRDDDYVAMGQCIARGLDNKMPVFFVQEGGYRMDKVPKAAADVICGFAEERQKSP